MPFSNPTIPFAMEYTKHRIIKSIDVAKVALWSKQGFLLLQNGQNRRKADNSYLHKEDLVPKDVHNNR